MIAYLFVLNTFVLIQYSSSQFGIGTDLTPLQDRGACISNPCLHNGLCSFTPTGFMCTCVDGYIGVMCERRSDDCPFDNSLGCVYGRCKLDMEGQPRCICNDGYEGITCSKPTGGCESKPCLNEGRCVDLGYNYRCECPEGISGSHCQIQEAALHECLMVCEGETNGGQCWHTHHHNVTVSWGYGDLICNSKQTCFDDIEHESDDVMEVQIKPISMQHTDNLIFSIDDEGSLLGERFIPHILPMGRSSETAFVSCNLSHGDPITNYSISRSPHQVRPNFLNVGTQYFLADINALYRCAFGLRLNVTMKTKNCALDDDSDDFCNGHGRCISDFARSSYTCLCCEGYIGKYCQLEDPCFIKPCQNGATCNIVDYGGGVSKHYCMCAAGYVGDTCDVVADPCVSHRCVNGGTCVPVMDRYRCECSVDYSGIYCEQVVNMCGEVRCRNDGVCVQDGSSFVCQCEEGYEGTLCEMNTNDCQSQPCNGICVDQVNGYTCECAMGRHGKHCMRVMEPCRENNCTNGLCVVNGEGGTSCSCGVAYTGHMCELKLDLCSDARFCVRVNAQSCHEQGDQVTCICRAGWGGSNCGVNIDDCASDRCGFGGRCVDHVNGFQCLCDDHHEGPLCQTVVNVSIVDVRVAFAARSCQRTHSIQGLESLRGELIDSFQHRCNCTLGSLSTTSVRVICMTDDKGQLLATLKTRAQRSLRDILCHTQTIPKISSNISTKDVEIERIEVLLETCTEKRDGNMNGVRGEDEGSGKLLVGLVMGLLLIVASFVVASLRMRSVRRKVAASDVGLGGGDVKSYDNSMYDKSQKYMPTETGKMGETSFTDLPKWPAGSNTLYERSRRQSPCRKSY